MGCNTLSIVARTSSEQEYLKVTLLVGTNFSDFGFKKAWLVLFLVLLMLLNILSGTIFSKNWVIR